MSPDHDETKELDAPWPFGPWAHKIEFLMFPKSVFGKRLFSFEVL